LWAVTRLRAIALKQSYGETQKRKVRRGWLWILRPRLGARPMLWKELFIESGLRFNVFMRVVLVLLIAGSFVPVVILFSMYIKDKLEGRYTWDLAEAMNAFVRILGSIVASLLLLAVAARSASCISNERDRQTLD